MGRISISAEGSQDVQRMLDAVEGLPEVAAKALEAGAQVLEPALKSAAPVRGSGEHIRDRIEVRVKRGKDPVVQVGVWDEPVAYYVEHGHGGPHPASPHPYMEPTVEKEEDAVMAAILTVLEKEL